MKHINVNKVACPNCGTSGSEHLETSSQIEYTNKVDGEEWINCPDCGALVEFDEDGNVLDTKFVEEVEWEVQIESALLTDL